MGTTADKLEYLNGTKAAIKTAIVAKGVTVPDGTPFREYATKIDDIQDVASLPTQAAKTVTPTTAEQIAVPAGVYTTGAVTVQGDVNLVPENIAEGVSIFGVTGTFAGGGGSPETVQGKFYSAASGPIPTYYTLEIVYSDGTQGQSFGPISTSGEYFFTIMKNSVIFVSGGSQYAFSGGIEPVPMMSSEITMYFVTGDFEAKVG